MLKNVSKLLLIFIFGIAGGIFADQILWPYFIERPLFYQYRLDQDPDRFTLRKEIIIEENTALQDAVEKVENVVVGIRTKTDEGKVLEGSGLVITSDGLLVTLADLVPRGSGFGFFVDGKRTHFQILKRDLEENLALVKIEEANLPTAGFADSDRVKLGERIFLVGIIFENSTTKKMVNQGIVKSFDKESIETNIIEKKAISGSPVFNIEGNILGLSEIDEQGQASLIPINKIRKFTGF